MARYFKFSQINFIDIPVGCAKEEVLQGICNLFGSLTVASIAQSMDLNVAPDILRLHIPESPLSEPDVKTLIIGGEVAMAAYDQDIRLFSLLCRLAMGLVGFILTASSMGLGQTCQIISVDDNDGLIKSPQNYRVLYETDDVRVLESTIPPHEAQSLHSFTRPAILYVQTSIDSKTISPGVDDPLEHLDDKSFRATVIRINAPGSYATTNLSNHAFHGVRVELKHPGCRLTSAKSSNSLTPAIEGEGVAMQSNGFHKVYEDGDARVSELNTQLHNLAVFRSTWPGFYYVVGTGSSAKTGRVASAFAIGAAAPQDLSVRPGAKIHIIRFELKQASH